MAATATLDDGPAFDRHTARAAELLRQTRATDPDIAWAAEKAGTAWLDRDEPARATPALRIARDQRHALRDAHHAKRIADAAQKAGIEF